VDYDSVIKEIQNEQTDTKKLISILSASYIALCKSTEELQKMRLEDLERFNSFQKDIKNINQQILELNIQQKLLIEENHYILEEIKELKKQ